MNIVLDTLASTRSARWLAHGLGLLAYGAFTWLGPGGALAWVAGLQMAAWLLVVELGFGLLDFKARRLKALAPGAFPFKKMDAGERAFLQDALATLPARSAQRSLAAWVLAGALATRAGVSWGGVALLLCTGAPLAALAQAWMGAALLKRVLPFFFFEDRDGYARGFSQWMPGLSSRALALGLAPLAVAGAPLALLAAFGEAITLPLLLLQGGLGAALALAGRALLRSLAELPLRDLAAALRRLGGGDLDALLDVTDGGVVGEATESFNRTLRSVDRRLFVLEKFGHAVLPGRSEGVLEGLRLDGEKRPVAVLSAQWLDVESVLRSVEPKARLGALSRFYEAVQEAVDRHQGCTFQLDDGQVMAVWGAPFNDERAVHAALAALWDLQGLLPVLARQSLQRDGLSLQWGLGVASGQAHAGLAGPRGRERYSLHGGPASEAKALARRGGAWLDERSAGAAASPFGVQIGSEGTQLVAGPSAPQLSTQALGFTPGDRL